MAEPILTAAELISFLEGQCKQSDSDREDWKLMTERLQRVIKHHENVGAELRARIAQLEKVSMDDSMDYIAIQARLDAATAENQRLRAELATHVETMCAKIKAADDESYKAYYILDSEDCIAVIRGKWKEF